MPIPVMAHGRMESATSRGSGIQWARRHFLQPDRNQEGKNMKRTITWAVVLFAGAALAQDFKLGSKIDDFTIQDLAGKPQTFSHLKGEVTAIVFISVQCPVSNAYNDRMNALYKDYSSKGVHFLFLNANSTEPAPAVAEHAKENGFAFPVYKDNGNVVADRFDAQATPETFVIDHTGTVVYHGSIDDSQQPARIQNQWLRRALDSVLAGKPVEKAETKAFGCTIKRVRKSL
jgi:peroxiredoxin